MEGEFVCGGDRARKKESRPETISDFRLLRAQGVAGPKSGGSITSQHRAGLSRATSGLGGLEKRDQSAGEERSLGSTSPSGERTAFKPVLSPFFVLKAV